VLPRLPTSARVAIARRGQPEAGWSQDGWDALSTKLWLQPLTDRDAHELVSRLEVDDAQSAQNLVQWAAGLPLALTAGAELALALHHGPSEREAFESWVGPALLRQIVDDEVGELNRDVLLVASIATTVDTPLLGEVLGVDPAPVMAWLRGLSFIEVVGARAGMHDRLRAALHAELRRTDAEYERDLRRRVLGLEPPTAFDNRDAVRQALRDYHDSIALAKNPLARGAGRCRERRPCAHSCSPHSTWRSAVATTTSSPGPSSSAATSSPTVDTTVPNANCS